VVPLSDVGESARDTDCASAGAAMPTVRMAAEAAPPSNIRQLYTKHSISILGNGIGRYLRIHAAGRTNLEPDNLTCPVKLTARLTVGRPSGGAWRQRPDELLAELIARAQAFNGEELTDDVAMLLIGSRARSSEAA